jgi:hypothetical protein
MLVTCTDPISLPPSSVVRDRLLMNPAPPRAGLTFGKPRATKRRVRSDSADRHNSSVARRPRLPTRPPPLHCPWAASFARSRSLRSATWNVSRHAISIWMTIASGMRNVALSRRTTSKRRSGYTPSKTSPVASSVLCGPQIVYLAALLLLLHSIYLHTIG